MMPCWTVQENTVSLRNPDSELLTAALGQLGFRVNSSEYSQRFASELTADRFSDQTSVQVKGGEVIISSANQSANLGKLGNEVKRAYAVQVVQAASRKFGWSLKQESPTKFTVARRY